MPESSKQEQLQAMLRPLSEQFTSQVASTIMSFVQQSVRDEVEVVLGRALPGVVKAIQPATPAAAAPPAPRVASSTPTKKQARPAGKKVKAPKIKCSKQRCDGLWYRPSGSDRKLCYKHFLEAGGKPPPGKKFKKK
jgi:hypothetical protein